MTLQSIRESVANHLNYDPTNSSYEEELNALINRAQTKVLGSHRWSFAQRDHTVTAYPDTSFNSISITAGDDFVTLPGLTGDFRKDADGHTLYLTSSTGVKSESYTISFADLNSDDVYLTKPIGQATGTYTVTVQYREINLPSEASSIEGVLDLSVGIPEPQRAMSKLNRDTIRLDPKTTGRSIYWIPSSSIKVPAPRNPSGTATTGALAQGVRTLYIYQTFEWGGRESQLSAPKEYNLTNVQTLTFTPPTIATTSGYYRKYYFTCPSIGIKRPVLITDSTTTDGRVDPLGGVTISPDLSLTTLQSEDFQTQAIPYTALGQTQRFNLWPMVAAQTNYQVRVMTLPQPMMEDLDEPLIPPDAAQVIEYEAAATASMKLDNQSLAKMLRDLRDGAYRTMCQVYLIQSTAPIVMLGGQTGTKGPISIGPYRVIP